MTNYVTESQNYTNMTGTTTVYTGNGNILGIFVASVSGSPTIKISDGAATLVNTFTPTVGWWTIPFRFQTSLIITIGATCDITVCWGA